MRNLLVGMSRTTEAVTPIAFLQVLRTVHPQFAQVSRPMRGLSMSPYAQQGLFCRYSSVCCIPQQSLFGLKDAEECYSQIVNSLREVAGLQGQGSAASSSKKFIEQYMMGQMRRE